MTIKLSVEFGTSKAMRDFFVETGNMFKEAPATTEAVTDIARGVTKAHTDSKVDAPDKTPAKKAPRTRRTKAQIAADQEEAGKTNPITKMAQNGAEDAPEDPPEDPPEETTAPPDNITLEKLRDKVREVVTKKGKDECAQVLAKFGAKIVSKIPTEVYPELWESLQAAYDAPPSELDLSE